MSWLPEGETTLYKNIDLIRGEGIAILAKTLLDMLKTEQDTGVFILVNRSSNQWSIIPNLLSSISEILWFTSFKNLNSSLYSLLSPR